MDIDVWIYTDWLHGQFYEKFIKYFLNSLDVEFAVDTPDVLDIELEQL